MHKIKVKNFKALKNVEIEVNSFLILLGEQASGKSTISKLIYFFKSLKQDYIELIYENPALGAHFADLLWKRIARKFYDYFGSTRHLENFEIVYTYGRGKHLILTLREDKSLKPTFTTNTFFTSLFYGDIDRYIRDVHNYESQESIFERRAFQKAITALEAYVGKLFNDSHTPVFIPAGRNITVNYPEQFKLDFYGDLRSGLAVRREVQNSSPESSRSRNGTQSVDLFLMVQFLQHTERLVKRFKEVGFLELIQEAENLFDEEVDRDSLEHIINRIQSILKGEYRQDRFGEQIVIDSENYVHLNNASSGQQEAIRILQDAFLIVLDRENAFRVIEEPEAHLYPIAQKNLLEVLAIVLNKTSSQIILTTHSPYILSLANNLLFSTRVAEKNKDLIPEIEEIVPSVAWLQPSKTDVYFLKDGYAETVFDDSVGLIDQNKLDEISEELGVDFQELYDIHARSVA